MSAKSKDTKISKNKPVKIPTMWWKNSWLLLTLVLVVLFAAVFLIINSSNERDDTDETSFAEALADIKFEGEVTEYDKSNHYLSTAYAYVGEGDTEKALEFFLKSYNEEFISEVVLIEIAKAYGILGDIENQRNFLNQLIDYMNANIESKEEIAQASDYYVIADAYIELGQNEDAKEFFEKGLQIAQKLPKSDEIQAMINDFTKRMSEL